MPRPLCDSPYLYGLHDPGGEYVMAEMNAHGWILFTEELGCDPANVQGRDYNQWADRSFGIMARLNHAYEPGGTLPISGKYAQFAQRCANFVAHSPGCHIWIIGNETNYPVERPGVQIDWQSNPPGLVNPGEVITPALYADCYRRCRDAIKGLAGHADDQVVVAAVAPWNVQTTYAGNPNGDWVNYFSDVLRLLASSGCDAIAIHTYTHGSDPRLVTAPSYMRPPFQHRHFDFRSYQDFMRAVPASMRSLPVYITETDQDEEWHNHNSGWVQRAYAEIDRWNHQAGNQRIHALVLYRWPRGLDRWGIEGKHGVVDDLRQALAQGYNWQNVTPRPGYLAEFVAHEVPGTLRPGQNVLVTITVRNAGTTTWPGGERQVGLRYRWLDAHGQVLEQAAEHTPVPPALKPGQQVALKAALAAPTTPGMYVLQWDLYEEEEGWFAQQGSAPLVLKVDVGTPAAGGRPAITDITALLPRDAASFVKRSAADIRHIVINHTAVRPEVGAERVAQAHRTRWPGIVAHYFITGDGQIQQTNPLDEVVAREPGWIFNGISVYVAGNFTDTIPTETQLNALASLLVWLMPQFDLGEDDTYGACELLKTQSPGLQWLDGARWKEILLARVRALAVLPPPPPVVPPPGRLEITDIALKLPRNPERLKARPLTQIKYLAISHTAVAAEVSAERIAQAHTERWGSILYQYYITADGSILQTGLLDWVVDLPQTWVKEAINIAVAGDFTVEIPSPAQLSALANLCAWLMRERKIGLANVRGMCEFVATASPGAQWNGGKQWRRLLFDRLAECQLPAAGASTRASQQADGGDPDLAGQIAALQTELAAARAETARLAGAQTDLVQQLAALEQNKLGLTQQVQELGRDKATLAEQLAAAGRNVADLQGRLDASAGEVAALKQQVGELAMVRDDLTHQAETLGQEKSALALALAAMIGERDTLSGQVQALERAKGALDQQVQALNTETKELNRTITELQAHIRTLEGSAGGSAAAAPMPAIKDITDQLPKHATERYLTRTLDSITHIAIHHTGAPANITAQQVAAYHVSKDWPGIGYHFYIDPDGTIWQVNRLETIAYNVYMQNARLIGISVSGTFNDVVPTPRQIEALGSLIAWLMQKYNIKLENVLGHREYPENGTECPGTQWMEGQCWRNAMMARVRAVQAGQNALKTKSIAHYVLLWQHQDAWAKDDWMGTLNYVARYRPTVGFSASDARAAEYVTIVGGTLGVSAEIEQALVRAGCKVERVAGNSFDETRQMLDELAKSGRRFMNFKV